EPVYLVARALLPAALHVIPLLELQRRRDRLRALQTISPQCSRIADMGIHYEAKGNHHRDLRLALMILMMRSTSRERMVSVPCRRDSSPIIFNTFGPGP